MAARARPGPEAPARALSVNIYTPFGDGVIRSWYIIPTHNCGLSTVTFNKVPRLVVSGSNKDNLTTKIFIITNLFYKINLHKPPQKYVIPSLRPPTLSRVACCLWSTDLYSERPSYRHLCVPPLRLCGSAESDLTNSLGEGWSDCPVTTILFGVGRLAFLSLLHIYYTTSRGKSQVVILHKLSPIFSLFFVQVAGSAPGRRLLNF